MQVWAHSAALLEDVSFSPEEREMLFLPETTFRVLDWYPATDFNLRRGLQRESHHFSRMDCAFRPIASATMSAQKTLPTRLP